MTQHLGDFGTAHESVDLTFGWFGEVIRIHPDLTDLAVMDLVSAMSGMGEMAADDENAAKAGQLVAQTVKDMGTVLVHPDDVAEFWRLAKANRQGIEDIANLAASLMSGVADRPTLLPSGSSDGQQPTDTSSTASSSSPAMELLNGRPDLQVAVLRAEERRVG